MERNKKLPERLEAVIRPVKAFGFQTVNEYRSVHMLHARNLERNVALEARFLLLPRPLPPRPPRPFPLPALALPPLAVF